MTDGPAAVCGLSTFCRGGTMLYPMFVQRTAFGGFVGELPDFPGCTPEGHDMDSLMAQVPEAVALWMRQQGVASLPSPSLPDVRPEDDECPPLLVDIR